MGFESPLSFAYRQKAASNTQNDSAPAPAAAPQEGFQMPGNFTGYEGFGGGNNFFNL